MAEEVGLTLRIERRWWFGIARVALIWAYAFGIYEDLSAAAAWLAKHGLRITAEPTNFDTSIYG